MGQRSSLTNEQKTKLAVGVGVTLALVGSALLLRAATSPKQKKRRKKKSRRREAASRGSSTPDSNETQAAKPPSSGSVPNAPGVSSLAEAIERRKGSKLPSQEVLYGWVKESLGIMVFGGKLSMKHAREIQACCTLLDPKKFSFEFLEMAIEWLKLFRRTEMQLHLQSNPHLVQYMNHPEVVHGLELRENSDLDLQWSFVEGLKPRDEEQTRVKRLMRLEFALRMGKFELGRQMLHELSLGMENLKGTELQLMYNATAMLGRWNEVAEFGRQLLEKDKDMFELEHQKYVRGDTKFDAKTFYEIATTDKEDLKLAISRRIPTDELLLQTQLVERFVEFQPVVDPLAKNSKDSASSSPHKKEDSPEASTAEKSSSDANDLDKAAASGGVESAPKDIPCSSMAIKFRGAIVEVTGAGHLGGLLGCFTGDMIYVTSHRDELHFREEFILKRRGAPDSRLFVGEHVLSTNSKTRSCRVEVKLGRILPKSLNSAGADAESPARK